MSLQRQTRLNTRSVIEVFFPMPTDIWLFPLPILFFEDLNAEATTDAYTHISLNMPIDHENRDNIEKSTLKSGAQESFRRFAVS